MLDPYLADAVRLAERRGLHIELRFERLDYFNSATISSIIRFIRTARTRALRTTLTYDGRRRWQRFSFGALAVFADENLDLHDLGATR